MTDAAAKTCFIAMPVRTTPEQAELYDDDQHWNHVLEHLFVPAVEQAGFEAWRPIAEGSDLIHARIVQQLIRADLVLVDMSHNNPNVFFELGVRTSVNKPVALVRCDTATPIPFDVSGINTHTYEPILKPWNHKTQVAALAKHLGMAAETSSGTNTMWQQFGMQLTATEPTTGASKEEALLEVIRREISQLSHVINVHPPAADSPRVTKMSDAEGSVLAVDQARRTRSQRQKALMQATERIAKIAAERDIRVTIEVTDDREVVVRIVEPQPSDESVSVFVDRVHSTFAERELLHDYELSFVRVV